MNGKSLILAALLTAFAACDRQAPDAPALADLPEPVLFRTEMDIRTEERENPKSALNAWDGEQLMIFGIHRRNGSLDLSESGRYIDGVMGTAPSGASGFVSLLNPATGNPFYYPSQGTLDFFACHLADAQVYGKNVNLQAMTLAFNITVDGTQDIMTAGTDRDADCRKAGAYVISPDNAYSSQAARKNVYPTLHFSHVLSRLSLSAKAMTAGLTVTDMRVTGRNTARLVPVRPDLSRPSLEMLPDSNPGTLKVEGSFPLSLSTETARPLGETMLVPGDARCVVFVSLRQADQEGTTDVTVDLEKIQSGLTFQPGVWYNIVLSIYGLEQVGVDVTMNPWVSGYGGFDLNTVPEE